MTDLGVEAVGVDSESDTVGLQGNSRYLFRQRRHLTDKAATGIPGSGARSASESDIFTASDGEGEPTGQFGSGNKPLGSSLAHRYRESKTTVGAEPGQSGPTERRSSCGCNARAVPPDPLIIFRREMSELVSVTKDALTSFSQRLDAMDQRLPSQQHFVSGVTGNQDRQRDPLASHQHGMKVALHPPKFDGQGDWSAFKIQFDNCADLAGWNTDMRAGMLGQCLEKTARRFYTNLSVSERLNFQELQDILARRFGDAPAEVYRSQLNARSRKSGESIQDLRDDLWGLVCKAYPGMSYDAKECLTLQSLLNAVDVNTRLHLASKDVVSLQGAVHAIVNYEAIKGADKKQKQPTNYDVLAAAVDNGSTVSNNGSKSDKQKGNVKKFDKGISFSDRLSKLEEAIQKISSASSSKSSGSKLPPDSGQKKAPDGQATSRVCFRCGDPGHFVKDCPLPRDSSKGNGGALDQA